jgi:hypothetical protein
MTLRILLTNCVLARSHTATCPPLSVTMVLKFSVLWCLLAMFTFLGLATACSLPIPQDPLGGVDRQLRTLSAETYTMLKHPQFPKLSIRIKRSQLCENDTSNAYTGYIDVGAHHLFFYFVRCVSFGFETKLITRGYYYRRLRADEIRLRMMSCCGIAVDRAAQARWACSWNLVHISSILLVALLSQVFSQVHAK